MVSSCHSFVLFHRIQCTTQQSWTYSGLWVDIELDISPLSDEQPFIFLFLKFYDDIRWHYEKCPLLRRVGTRSGPGPPPPRRGWGWGLSWPRPRPRAQSPGPRHPGRGQWPPGEPGQGWSRYFKRMFTFLFIHSFTAMLHNCSLFVSEQWMASRPVLTAALLAVRQRPAPSSVNLMSPPVPVISSYFMWPSELPTLAGFRVWACIPVKLRLTPNPGISIPQPWLKGSPNFLCHKIEKDSRGSEMNQTLRVTLPLIWNRVEVKAQLEENMIFFQNKNIFTKLKYILFMQTLF